MPPMSKASTSTSCVGFADSKCFLEGNRMLECVVQGLEHSMDVLTCDESRTRKTAVEGKPLVPLDLASKDYAQLHDDCLESLVQEQKKLQEKQRMMPERKTPPLNLSSSSLSSSIGFNTGDTTMGDDTHRPPACLKIAIKLHRRTSVKKISPIQSRKTQVSPMPTESETSSLLSGKSEGSLIGPIHQRELPEPTSFIHTKCRLQKDKGKGEPIGSKICAIGREECVEKLRQKMELLTQVAMNTIEKKKKGSAFMKRRSAKVTELASTYTETRSVIDLKMGFLTMTYGVLLRWDTMFTGKVVLVVLRKMCHDSFYNTKVIKQPASHDAICDMTPILVRQEDGGRILILQRMHGTEVAVLEPPYLVAQPVDFSPSLLSIRVHRFEGFHEKSTWTLHVTLGNVVYKARKKDSSFDFGETMDWEVPAHHTDFQFQVAMYEQKQRLSKRKRLVAKKTMSLNFLETPRNSQWQQLEFPCLADGKVIINVFHRSDYAYWLQKELEARRQKEVNDPSNWISSFYPIYVDESITSSDDSDHLWELCCFW
mmetsp:Transcript_4268/g.6655  ORF Transcript_4268/g.6655 Transcript_4268/m.6655 type:complete len:540 (+) Transcript_4268:125-1744(+)